MGEKEEPLRYTGPDRANVDYHHGALSPAVGVQSYQVLRANREHPEEAEGTGWTYNHSPMLAYWKGSFYLEYLSNPVAGPKLLYQNANLPTIHRHTWTPNLFFEKRC